MSEEKKKKGGQIDNKNAEKWTPEKIEQLGVDLLAWMLPDLKIIDSKKNIRVDVNVNNIFYRKFLLEKGRLTKNLLQDMANKNDSFRDVLAIAKEIQELKLADQGVKGDLNSGMTQFMMRNIHGYVDKSEINHNGEIKTGGGLDLAKLSDEEIRNLIVLTKKAKGE